MERRFPYGGQAVIEGVMIRGQSAVGTACRLLDGQIVVRTESPDSLVQRHRWLRLPFVRGTPALIDAIRIGFRALIFSANVAVESEGQNPVSPLTFALTIAGALVVGIGLFVLLPSALIPRVTHDAFLLNLLEGLARLVILVGYILIISRMQNVRRIFQYHGAEHQVIHAFESGSEVNAEAASRFSTSHSRCGTSFLLLVVVVGVLVHALVGWPAWHWRLLSRLLLFPVVAGVAYELIRLAGAHPESLLLRALVAPGVWLQRLTTRQPSPDQVEVALKALEAVLAEDSSAIALAKAGRARAQS